MDELDLTTNTTTLTIPPPLPSKINSMSAPEDIINNLAIYKDHFYGIFELIDDVEKSIDIITNVYDYLLQIINSNDLDLSKATEITEELHKQYENAKLIFNEYTNTENSCNTELDSQNNVKHKCGIGKRCCKIGAILFILSFICILGYQYIKGPLAVAA